MSDALRAFITVTGEPKEGETPEPTPRVARYLVEGGWTAPPGCPTDQDCLTQGTCIICGKLVPGTIAGQGMETHWECERSLLGDIP